MSEISPSPVLTARLKSSLSQLRLLLLHSPAQLSLDSAGPLLEQIALDLSSLPHLDPKPSPADLRQIQNLSSSVQSLYQGALNFIAGLSDQSIQNGAWDAASYSAEGVWQSSSVPLAPRLTLKG